MAERLAGMAAGRVEGHGVEALAQPATDLDKSQPQRLELQLAVLTFIRGHQQKVVTLPARLTLIYRLCPL